MKAQRVDAGEFVEDSATLAAIDCLRVSVTLKPQPLLTALNEGELGLFNSGDIISKAWYCICFAFVNIED